MPRLRSARRANRSERGVAMLLVLAGIAVLALVANEVRYNSVVELRLATNQRDELRAHYLAKSGIGISRLMLRFQKQIDSIQIPNLSSFTDKLPPGVKELIPPGLLPPGGQGGGGMSIQLWKMAKIDCHMLAQMVPEYDEKGAPLKTSVLDKKFDFDKEMPELGQAQSTRRFGSFTGCFDTVITDEEERINLARLDALEGAARALLAQLVTTLGDKKYEFLFEKEDSNRVKVTPVEVITNLRDWVDEDETGSTLNFSTNGDPFLKGFSDENGGYVKYDPAYRAKNARFDSLDEVFMVHGVNDRFMAAFKEKFTVYPNVNSRLNINTDDPILLEVAIRSVADPLRPDPRMADPIFMDTLIKKIRSARVFALFGMSAADFVNLVGAAGIPVNPTIQNNVQGNTFIGDKSTTYRVRVTGSAGDVTRTITAVVRLDDALGRLVYWREE
jgi:general secretion pathway protein K